MSAAEEKLLPCDVMVAPSTIIRKGCSLATLLLAISRREGKTGVTWDMPPRPSPSPAVRDGTLSKEELQRRANLCDIALSDSLTAIHEDPDSGEYYDGEKFAKALAGNHLKVVAIGERDVTLREALEELANAAEGDLKSNQALDEKDEPGGWWSTRTENAIREARKLLSHPSLPPKDESARK